MAASGSIPSFRISVSVRFDPDAVATWLNEKQAPGSLIVFPQRDTYGRCFMTS